MSSTASNKWKNLIDLKFLEKEVKTNINNSIDKAVDSIYNELGFIKIWIPNNFFHWTIVVFSMTFLFGIPIFFVAKTKFRKNIFKNIIPARIIENTIPMSKFAQITIVAYSNLKMLERYKFQDEKFEIKDSMSFVDFEGITRIISLDYFSKLLNPFFKRNAFIDLSNLYNDAHSATLQKSLIIAHDKKVIRQSPIWAGSISKTRFAMWWKKYKLVDEQKEKKVNNFYTHLAIQIPIFLDPSISFVMMPKKNTLSFETLGQERNVLSDKSNSYPLEKKWIVKMEGKYENQAKSMAASYFSDAVIDQLIFISNIIKTDRYYFQDLKVNVKNSNMYIGMKINSDSFMINHYESHKNVRHLKKELKEHIFKNTWQILILLSVAQAFNFTSFAMEN